MAGHNIGRPVQIRKFDSGGSEDDYSDKYSEVGAGDLTASGSDESGQSATNSDDGSDTDKDLSEPEINTEDDSGSGLRDISFGALARAQERLGAPSLASKKRKRAEVEEDTLDKQSQYVAKEPKHPDSRPNQPLHRSSKHAPTVLSSKHRVSRKRPILANDADNNNSPLAFTHQSQKSRDPRFDAAIRSTTLNTKAIEHADKNYSFLTDYQASEILALKSQLSKTKDADLKLDLRRQIMSLEAKIRNYETRTREREILRTHHKQEKEAIREGRKAKPFFLKQSSVRKQIEDDRLEGMGKKARDKREKKKVKRLKGKEGKEMPRFRRIN